MIRNTYKSGVLFLLIASVIVLRIIAEDTSYVSPDSAFYLSAADHLMKGEGLMAPHPEAPGSDVYFAIWPAGYPLCIAAMGLMTETSALIASKMVNLLFLGFTFILLFRWFGEKSWFVALYFCSFGMLEIYSYTWSEAPFLFFVLLLAYFISKDLERDTGPLLFFQLFFCLVALFLFRYAGLIYFVGTGFLMAYFGFQRKWIKAVYYFGALLFAGIIAAAYLYVNKQMTGYYTGIGDRVQLEWESTSHYFVVLIRGVGNQLTWARQFFSETPDMLYVALLTIQLALFVLLMHHRKKMTKPFFSSMEIKTLSAFALFYLLFIAGLRKFQPFDFDYRILAPFSLPLFIALFGRLIKHDAKEYFERVRPWVIGFMLLSLLLNLPKEFLLEWVKGFIGV